MSIIDYIPFSRQNAISRSELPKVSNINDDRITRSLIEEARACYAILNMQDGKGYFRPTGKERDLALRWKMQTEARIRSLQKSLGGVNRFLSESAKCENVTYVCSYTRRKSREDEKPQVSGQLTL